MSHPNKGSKQSTSLKDCDIIIRITDGEKGAKREIITRVKRWRNVHGGIRKSLWLITMSRSRLRAYYITLQMSLFTSNVCKEKTQLHTMIQRTCVCTHLLILSPEEQHFAWQIRCLESEKAGEATLQYIPQITDKRGRWYRRHFIAKVPN